MSEVLVPDDLNRLFVSYSKSFSKAEATKIIADLRTDEHHENPDSLESDDLYGTLKKLYKTGKINEDDIALLELIAGKDRVTKVTELINDYKKSHVTSKDDVLIGRSHDRKQLLAHLTDNENHAISLYGPSGVGKTILAKSVGSELEKDSWEVLTFDARDLIDISSLYMCILYELGLTTLARNVQEMQKEQSLADLEKMRILCDLSDKSSESKTLLIFDNIEEKIVINDNKFATFINEITNLPGCNKGSLKIIITSTEDIHRHFESVKPQVLEPLPNKESSQFICRSSKLGQKRDFSNDLKDQDYQALSKIAEYCRRLPYLLKAAEQIMRNGFISTFQLLEKIEAQIEKGVPENFALTAAQFDSISNERLKELAVKLCVFQRPFSASATIKVSGISPDFAEIDLEYLVKNRVVTKTISDNKARYDIHSLFKDFVTSYLRKKSSFYDEVYQRAEQMFGIHFVDKLLELANHLEKDFIRVYKKMDKNRLNFEMALQLSSKNKKILSQLLHIKYHESICRVAMLLESLKSISERRRLFKTWADILENEGNLLNSANMRCWESLQLADMEGTASSERVLNQAESCLKQASEHLSLDAEQFSAIKGLFLYCEGNLYYRKHGNLVSKEDKENKHGLIENALRKFEVSLEIHKQIYGDDHTMIVRVRNMIGNCYMEKEEPVTAEKCYLEALEMMKKLTNGTENHSEIPTFYNQLSQVYEKLGDKASKETGMLSSVKHFLGRKSDAVDHYERAVESSNRALQLNEQLNLSDTLSTATFNQNLANVLMALERYDESLECAKKARKLRTRLLGRHPETVKILYLTGFINEWRLDLGAALQSYEDAFNMEELLPLENHSVVVSKLGKRLEAMCKKCNEKIKLKEYRPRIKQLQETIEQEELAHLGVYILKNMPGYKDDFKLTLLCSPSHIEISLEMRESYVKLGGRTSIMKINEEASIEVEGDFIPQNEVVLKLLKENECKQELNLKSRNDTEGTNRKIKIKFFSRTYDRPLEELIVYVPVNQFTNRDNTGSQATNRENEVREEQYPSGTKDDPDSSDVYRMKSDPRGLIVIINIRTFDADPTISDYNKNQLRRPSAERKGSEKDVDELFDLFGQYLNFKVCTIIDKTSKEILEELRAIAKNIDYENYDCLAVCIMSHGNKDQFCAHDGKLIKVTKVLNMFSNSNCKIFCNKPKLFFIETCRGQKGKGAKNNVTANRGPSGEEDTFDEHTPLVQSSTDPDMADMLIAYSCFENYISNRDPEKGSCFIQILVRVFKVYARKEHVLDMMTRVNNEVHNLMHGAESGRTQVPAPESTLLKKLYFWPEIDFEEGS